MHDLTPETIKALNIAIVAFCSLEAIIVLVSSPRVIRRTRTSKIFYKEMIAVTIAVVFYTVSLIVDWGHGGIFSILLRALAYIGIYAIFFIYVIYIRENINKVKPEPPIPASVIYVSLVIAATGAILWSILIFDPDFSGNATNAGILDASFWIGHSGELILIGITIGLLILHREILETRQLVIMASMPLLLLMAIILEHTLATGIELRYPAMALGLVLVYAQHHLEVETRFEREEAENLHNRMSMAAGRMRPHYLYNVLTSIYYLCETDPKKAQHAIGTFSEYMRDTLEAMEKRELVSFSWELNEIKNYLELERLRFGERVKVNYDIEFEEFRVPPLSIQPLVENAVKHGIAPLEDGGTVSIISRRLSDGGVQIQVIDDGRGFNVERLKTQDVTHEGVANVRDRLQHEVGGDLTITSAPGKGTTATVTIRPKKYVPGA